MQDEDKLTKELSQVIDLKGFTSPITNAIDKLKYEYFIPLDKLVLGNVISINGVTESNLEATAKTIHIHRLVEDGVRFSEREKDLLDNDLVQNIEDEIQKNTQNIIKFAADRAIKLKSKVGNVKFKG